MQSLQEQGFHSGYGRDESAGRDRGFAGILAEAPPGQGGEKSAAWFEKLDAEARRDGKVVAVWHAEAGEAMVRSAIGNRRLVVIEAGSVEEALAQWHHR
jgi:hypothetical protein